MNLMELLMAVGNAPPVDTPTYIDDVFNISLFNGSGATNSIVTGVDLTTSDGGLIIAKQRNSASGDTFFLNTVRGTSGVRFSNTGSEIGAGFSSYNSNGFTLSSSSTLNTSGQPYEAWTFKKAPKFYTQVQVSHTTGTATNVDLSELGEVGLVMVKILTVTGAWWVWHSGLTAGYNLRNTTAAQSTAAPYLSVSGTTLTIASGQATGTYMVYAWANDIASSGLIRCGLYTGNGSASGPVVNLGWEPQFLLIKRIDTTGAWAILDVARGIPIVGNQPFLAAEAVSAETVNNHYVNLLANGFQLASTATVVNASAGKYIYMAIRRSNKPPTDPTKVIAATVYTGTNADNRLLDLGIAPDTVLLRRRSGNGAGYEGFLVADRLRGQEWYKTDSSGPVATVTADGLDQQLLSSELGTAFSANNGIFIGNASGTLNTSPNINASTTANDHVALSFKRAAKFYDHVVYNGTGVADREVPHNLGVKPEFLWVKRKESNASNTIVWHKSLPSDNHQLLLDIASSVAGPFPNEITSIQASKLVLGSSNPNASGGVYSLHMFASVPGVCKVGSFDGLTGSNVNVDCGFAAPARIVIIFFSTTWAVFDSARGISPSSSNPVLSFAYTNSEGLNAGLKSFATGFSFGGTTGVSYPYIAFA